MVCLVAREEECCRGCFEGKRTLLSLLIVPPPRREEGGGEQAVYTHGLGAVQIGTRASSLALVGEVSLRSLYLSGGLEDVCRFHLPSPLF